MQTLRFRLAISSETYLRYYQGQASQVSVTSEDGRRVQFPAKHLRPYVMHDGVHGRYELIYNEDNKFVSLRKL